MNRKKILAFDFDGTLVNSMERLTDIAEKVISEFFGIQPDRARRLYQLTSGLPFQEQLKSLYPKERYKRSRAERVFEKEKRAGYLKEYPFPDTLSTIHYLKNKGYTIVISSNSEQDLVDSLVLELGIPCDIALGYRKNFSKGSPHFLYILEQCGGELEDIVFIGDSIKDGERAFENRIDFIGMEGLFSKKDFQSHFPGVPVISRLAELKKIF